MYPVIDKAKTAERINNIMRAANKTPADIQRYLGLTCVQTVYRWLEGVNIPSIDNLYALSCLFQVPMDVLIVGNGKNCAQTAVSQAMVFDRRHFRAYYFIVRGASVSEHKRAVRNDTVPV